ncbi:MAG: DAK2 domain-containing protein [Chloroflexota bacterium]
MTMTEIETVHRQVCDGYLLKWLVAAGQAWLERNMEHVNQLNVFPVPDGDTGTNMHLTMRSAYNAVSKLEDEPNVGLVAQTVADGALMGARGNSGVILSQLLAGFAEGLSGKESFNAQEFAAACEVAVEYAYKSVVDPVEGTILTVSREGVEAVVELVNQAQDIALRNTLETMVEAAKVSLDGTPDLLPVLKDAGVVDSGGTGFLYIIEGMLRFLEGKPVKDLAGEGEHRTGGENWQDALVPDDEEGYGYDVQFLIHGANVPVEKVREDIDAMGWSTLVVGKPELIKVHVHVHNPAEPINYAIATLGAEIDDIVVENMQLQYKDYVADREARESGMVNEVDGAAVVTVVAGVGLHDLFTNDLKATYIIHGGQTMNPSTEDFVAAIDAIPNKDIILLPNNKNIVMAANQAAKISATKNVSVVPSRTIPQGIAAMFGYVNMTTGDPNAELDDIAEEMREAMGDIATVEITQATRTVTLDGVEVSEGQYIGIVDGKLLAAGNDLTNTVKSALEHGIGRDSELVTLYYGEDVTDADAEAMADALANTFDEQEFEIVAGGQSLYPYLISIE